MRKIFKSKSLKGFIVGFISAMVMLSSVYVYAQGLEVVLNKVNIAVNGIIVGPAGQNFKLDNGSSVPYSILYEGTTYLPIRKVAEVLGKEVTWDGTTNTAGIKDKAEIAQEVATPEPVPAPEPAPQKTIYWESQYEVGKDIPAGKYAVFASGGSGYYKITFDANADDLAVIQSFSYNSIITVYDGYYLTLSRCYAVPLDQANIEIDKSDSTFEVGTHIKEGKYKLTGIRANYTIYSAPRGDYDNKILSIGTFSGDKYITVKDGQYLQINNCTGDFVKP